jgi:hypothetical protein
MPSLGLQTARIRRGDRMKKNKKKLTLENVARTAGGLRVRTHIKAGPNRRKPDPIGQFNCQVEIEGVVP